MVTGTSIGSANAAFLAVHGYNLNGIEKLEEMWQATMQDGLLSSNLWWETMRILFKQGNGQSLQKIRDFAIQNGLKSDLRFCDLDSVYLYPVATDLNTGNPVIFGLDPQESVLESILSVHDPAPMVGSRGKRRTSCLWTVEQSATFPSKPPCSKALPRSSRWILFDPQEEDDFTSPGLRPFLWKLDRSHGKPVRTELEIKLAEAKGVPVKHIILNQRSTRSHVGFPALG